MTLDDVVKEAIVWRAGRGIASYGRSALREAGRTIVASAIFPTTIRQRRDERRPAFR